MSTAAWEAADAWNAAVPVGTLVRFWPGPVIGSGQIGKTTSRARVIRGAAVVRIGREVGGISLDRVTPCLRDGAL